MLTYTGRRNLFGDLVNNSEASNLTLADELMFQGELKAAAGRSWVFNEKSTFISTIASTQFVNIPNNVQKIKSVSVIIGGTTYIPSEAPDKDFWESLNSTTQTSNIPQFFFILDGQIGLYPIPATSTPNAITITYRRRPVKLSVPDYTTGTIVSITNGATTVTGAGTTWTANMAGRYIKIDGPDGDSLWYEVASVTGATVLELTKTYDGSSIVAGSSTYAIGQVGILPEEYDILPVYKAAELYFTSIKSNANKATLYKNLYEDRYEEMKNEEGKKTDNNTISGDVRVINPNLTVQL